jgi:hypothetical protein
MFAALTLGVAVVTAGCSPWATYPPIETPLATKLSKPTFEPVPTVMAEAIKHARTEFIKDADLPINLPAGANWKVYDAVFSRLGDGRHMTSPGEAALHITQVRTRGSNAQVDMIYPRPDGLYQSVTLTFSRTLFDPWHITATRKWQVRDLRAPEPNYIGPTAQEQAELQAKEEKKRAKEAEKAAKEAEKAAKDTPEPATEPAAETPAETPATEQPAPAADAPPPGEPEKP